jgi:hypothetical protein
MCERLRIPTDLVPEQGWSPIEDLVSTRSYHIVGTQLQIEETPKSVFANKVPLMMVRALEFQSAVNAVKVGDMITFRVGKMNDGEFGLGKVINVGDGTTLGQLRVHCYGLKSDYRITLRKRLRGRYYGLYVTSAGVVAADKAPEGPEGTGTFSDTREDFRDTRIVRKIDVLTRGFQLNDTGELPPHIRKVLSDNVLRRLSLFRARVQQSLCVKVCMAQFGQRLNYFISA